MQSATTQRFSMRPSPGAILNVELLRLIETVQDEALHELAELATGAEA
jgi:hypothetical protein